MHDALELGTKCWQRQLGKWRNFIIAQMVRGQLDAEEQMKSKKCCHVQQHWENHMLFVGDNNEVFLFSPAHWLLLSLLGCRKAEEMILQWAI